jgi:hypothetical protein
MHILSRYAGWGRGLWESLEEGTLTVKGTGTYLRAVVREGRVVEQLRRTSTQCTFIKHGQEYTVRQGKKIIEQVFYEPGSQRAIRRGGLWRRATNLTLCGAGGILECYSTASGLYAREVFTYDSGLTAYRLERGQEKLEVYRPDGKPWIVLEGQIRLGFHPLAHRLNAPANSAGFLSLAASLNLNVTVYGPGGTRAITRGCFVNRQKQGRWLEDGRVTYYLSGVQVTRKLCEEDPDEWDGYEVLRIPNAQLRSSFLNKMGYQRLLEKVEHEVIDTDDDGSQLLAITVASEPYLRLGIDRIMHLLKVICPSTGAAYVLRVPPDIRTCRQARHWTFGLGLDSVRKGTCLDLLKET